MPDVMTPTQRSRCMSRIRSSATKPELALRRALWAMGVRYRLKSKLPGKPDIIFTRPRLAVFVDGCFWHGCPIHGTRPKSNSEYWNPKIERNQLRDAEVREKLEALGWRVLRFWDHDLKQDLDAVVRQVLFERRSLLEARDCTQRPMRVG
jgi:DNA mismatch endonuclease (patch repair protein)